jgi:hypothetical protein
LKAEYQKQHEIERINKMSHPTLLSEVNNPHVLRIIAIIGWVCALLILLVPIIAYLIEKTDLPLFITYLSDVRVTPVWPQIGLIPMTIP